jgi:hypothetical protein
VSASTVTCPWCGARGEPVRVHGHGQCPWCGNNIEPCCTGADAFDEAGATTAIDTAPDQQLFPRVFAQLGGAAATVTRDALVFALVQRLGTDLDDARVVLEAAERLGIVEPGGDALYRLRRADRAG